MKNPAAVALGRLGGLAKSKRKTEAARKNGQKGGWPKGKRRMAWQPIETAPKDGMWVLGYELPESVGAKAGWNTHQVMQFRSIWIDSGGQECEPIFWQPLPPPPCQLEKRE